MSDEFSEFSGYHDCPCRDCFEIAIGCHIDEDGEQHDEIPGLCHECQEAGCSLDGDEDCQVEYDEPEVESEDDEPEER